jgi:hypothetical protein
MRLVMSSATPEIQSCDDAVVVTLARLAERHMDHPLKDALLWTLAELAREQNARALAEYERDAALGACGALVVPF